MKFPKNRANLYIVVRTDDAICGAFSDFAEADDFRAVCEQEFLEKTGQRVRFFVKLTTYYG